MAQRPLTVSAGTGTVYQCSVCTFRHLHRLSLRFHLERQTGGLSRAIERGSSRFDFGRSTRDSNTYRFKKQWGAQPSPAIWQYYLRQGRCDALRPESGRYALPIRIWQRLPLPLTRCLGPFLVRGIP